MSNLTFDTIRTAQTQSSPQEAQQPLPPIQGVSMMRPAHLNYVGEHKSRSIQMIIMPLSIVLLCIGVTYAVMRIISIQKMIPAVAPVAVIEEGVRPTPSPATFPTENARIQSPLHVETTVPAGWVSEGVVPIELTDDKGVTIVRGVARERVPGEWQSGKPVRVTAQLTFKTVAQYGYFVVHKDNPSGMSQNDLSYKITVRFAH